MTHSIEGILEISFISIKEQIMFKRSIHILVPILFIGACTPATITAPPDAPTPATATSTPATTEPATDPDPTPGPVQILILSDGVSLESAGPWLVFNTEAGFWVVSQEGDEVGVIPPPTDYYIRSWEAAPGGGLIALLKDNGFEKVLEVMQFPNNQLLLSENLTDYAGPGPSFEDDGMVYKFERDRYQAVGDIAWSSDGGVLAFVSSHLGPTPDVYVFTVATGNVAQITSGPLFTTSLSWSPDDKLIFHAEVSDLFAGMSGTGYADWVFYSARADGSEVFRLSEGLSERGEEFVVAWYDDDHVLLQSGYWWCGFFDLRMVNIENGVEGSIWPDQYDLIAYDPANTTALIWDSTGAGTDADCGYSGERGLYLVSVPDGHRERVPGWDDQHNISSMSWDEKVSKFVIELDTAWALVDNSGEVEILEEQPIFSPDRSKTALLGYKGKSLSIVNQDGEKIGISTKGAVLHPTWSPDGTRLFYFEESTTRNMYDLFMLQTPDLTTELIATEIFNKYDDAPVWVMP
jgi:hypothetical protein